jgi:hypothetical protein
VPFTPPPPKPKRNTQCIPVGYVLSSVWDGVMYSARCGMVYSFEKVARIVTLRFGAGRQKMALTDGQISNLSRRTCTCEYGLQSCRRKCRRASRNGLVNDAPTRNPSRYDSQLVASLCGRGGSRESGEGRGGEGEGHARGEVRGVVEVRVELHAARGECRRQIAVRGHGRRGRSREEARGLRRRRCRAERLQPLEHLPRGSTGLTSQPSPLASTQARATPRG